MTTTSAALGTIWETNGSGVATAIGDVPPASDVRLSDGVSFALDDHLEGPALWGAGEEIAWSPGEPLLIVGPDGVGKTTIAQRLALARCGVHNELLGMPVRPAGREEGSLRRGRPPEAGGPVASPDDPRARRRGHVPRA